MVVNRCNFNNNDLITDIGTIGTISFGNFATMQINMNKDKTTLTKVFKANIYTYRQFHISFKIIINKKFLVSKTQGLYCHELIFCKWVHLLKPRYQDES